MRLLKKTPEKLCDNLFLVGSSTKSHPYDCSVYAVINDNSVVLIDCGTPQGLDKIIDNLQSIGVDPANVCLIIGTHCHYDHIGSAGEFIRRFKNAKLALHIDDAIAVENGDSEVTCADWLFDSFFDSISVDIKLTDGEILDFGGFEFKINHMPGHSPGSITIETCVGSNKVVFTGDSYIPSCDKVGYDFENLVETWRKLITTDADVVCPGHEFHSYSDPVVLAMMGILPTSLFNPFLSKPSILKPVASASSFYYENMGRMIKPFRELISNVF